jgi:hypothetical protein
LFDSSGPARPCNSQNNFILARTLFLPGGEVFNEAERCNIRAKNPPQISTSKKDRIDGLQHSTNTKSPRGAAGPAQQVRKIEVFFKRLSEQKSPKGAAGLAQQVHKIEVFLKRPSVQKSPKGAARLIQQARQNASALHPCKSLHQETIRAQTNYRCSRTNIINVPDQACNAPMDIAGCAKAHSLIIQTIVTHVQRGHLRAPRGGGG